jgi:thioredoxin-related protein
VNIKSLLLLPFCLLLYTACFSQQEFDTPKNIPPFNMLLSDGVTYHNADHVQKGKPLMIIYFDPECGHCQDYTKDIVKNITKFSNVQIVMICAAPGIPPLKKFVTDFGLEKYKNIKVGTEGMYHATMNFYHVDVTPFTALYDKNGVLITSYRKVPTVQALVSQLTK